MERVTVSRSAGTLVSQVYRIVDDLQGILQMPPLFAEAPSRSPRSSRPLLAQARALARSAPVSAGEPLTRSSSCSPSRGRPLAISA